MLYVLIVAAFTTVLVVANIISIKQVTVFGFRVTAGEIVFPVSYILGDVLTEVYGYRRARQAILVGFACNLLGVAAIAAGGALPSAPFWHDQAAYDAVFEYTPRLLAGSFVAYFVGELTNSAVMAKLKVATGGRFLWTRTISSTILGQGVDTFIAGTISFLGVVPDLWKMLLTVWIFKVLYEIAATPLTYLVVNKLKKVEGVDVYDAHTPVFGHRRGGMLS